MARSRPLLKLPAAAVFAVVALYVANTGHEYRVLYVASCGFLYGKHCHTVMISHCFFRGHGPPTSIPGDPEPCTIRTEP